MPYCSTAWHPLHHSEVRAPYPFLGIIIYGNYRESIQTERVDTEESWGNAPLRPHDRSQQNNPQKQIYYTHYRKGSWSWSPDLNGATVLGKLGLRSVVITSCCYTFHARTSQPSRRNLGLCQYRTGTLVIPKVDFQRQYYRRNVSTNNPDHDSKSQQLSERGKRKRGENWGHGISVHRRNPGVNRNKLFISCKWSLSGWRPSWKKSERLWINKPAIPTVEQERSYNGESLACLEIRSRNEEAITPNRI